MEYGVFERCSTVVSVYNTQEKAQEICNYLNIKHNTNDYYVKEIYKVVYGIFEIGYTSITLYNDREMALRVCNNLNTRFVKKRVNGDVRTTVKQLNKYYVKEIKM